MYKHILFAILATGTLLLTSCGEETAVPTPRTLTVVSADANFPVEGGERTVTVARPAQTAYAQDAWAAVSVKDGRVVVSTEPNTDEQSRNTLLVVKDAAGDSAMINVRQSGAIFRLPVSATIEAGDEAVSRTFDVHFNVPLDITGSADWIDVKHTPEGKVSVNVAANATGRPRVGWILSRAFGVTDSVKVTQASLADMAGTYIQYSSTLAPDQTKMVDTVNTITITRLTDTKALFTIDDTFNWECTFTPGRGLLMMNGKILFTDDSDEKNPVYLISLIAANDFREGHLNAIIGTREGLRLSFGKQGELVFTEHERITTQQVWNSYAIGISSAKKVDQESYGGLFASFIRPRLEYVPTPAGDAARRR